MTVDARRAAVGTHVPVLVVGGGPVGLAMALLLAQQGVPSIIVERRPPRVESAPKAHVINPRSLEILRALGLDVDRMRELSPSAEDQRWSRFMTRLAGIELGRIALDVPEREAAAMTPTPLLNVAQPKFEAFLREQVEVNPLIELRMGHAFRACAQDETGVTSTIETEDASYRLRSAFVVAADGANSTVREHLGMAMDGNPAVRPRVTIHFEADLRPVVRDYPAILYWILDPAVAGTFIAYDIERTWVYTPRAVPETFERSVFSDAHCADLVLRAIGRHDVDIRIKHVVPWMMAAQVATAYRSGRCLLVGDAAHRFPPTGGLGLNTGLQDAHNLAWKIARHLRGAAPQTILDSYDQERRPIAMVNTRQSLHNSERLPELFQLAERSIVDGAVNDVGRAALAAEIATHKEHFHSPGLQLGFSYGPPVRGPADPTRYVPSWEEGDRLPHVALGRGGRVSSLDLLDPARFTLFLPAEQTGDWNAVTGRADVHRVVLDDDAWRRATSGKVVLVRPDGHIAAAAPLNSEARGTVLRALARWGAILAVA